MKDNEKNISRIWQAIAIVAFLLTARWVYRFSIDFGFAIALWLFPGPRVGKSFIYVMVISAASINSAYAFLCHWLWQQLKHKISTTQTAPNSTAK
ncbi:MAG: hypothetical protein NTY77_08760 [Elusimicrobia bacterium]|nr:hypothetical protein [Elusimicrobiota bacterium]